MAPRTIHFSSLFITFFTVHLITQLILVYVFKIHWSIFTKTHQFHLFSLVHLIERLLPLVSIGCIRCHTRVDVDLCGLFHCSTSFLSLVHLTGGDTRDRLQWSTCRITNLVQLVKYHYSLIVVIILSVFHILSNFEFVVLHLTVVGIELWLWVQFHTQLDMTDVEDFDYMGRGTKSPCQRQWWMQHHSSETTTGGSSLNR